MQSGTNYPKIAKQKVGFGRSQWVLVLFAIQLFFFLAICESANAQDRRVITLTNGLQLEGAVGDIKTYSLEVAAVDPYNTNKKIVLVDDGLRRVFVCFDRIASDAPSNYRPLSFDIWQQTFTESASDGFASQVLRIGPLNEFGHRWLEVYDPDGRHQTFTQGITEVTPIYCEVNTLVREETGNKVWQMRLATKSIPPNVLMPLMNRQITDVNSPTKYWLIFDVLTEARMFELALEQLTRIEAQFPDLKSDVERSRTRIKSLVASQILNEMRLRRDIGQPQLANQMAQVVVTEGMGEDKQIEFSDFQLELSQNQSLVDETRRRCNEIISRFTAAQTDIEKQQPLKGFLEELETNLNLNTISRFAGFLQLLQVPDISDEQLVSQIVSRWYLGNAKIEENFAVAESLIPVYSLVQEYLGESTDERRREILEQLRSYEGGAPEYIAPMVNQMPPPQPVSMENVTAAEPVHFKFSIPGIGIDSQEQTLEYLVHLPPEYDPYRKYPLLVVLPGLGQSQQTLDLWTGDYNQRLDVRQGLAPRNGYITLSVDWKAPGQNIYGYSARETLTVLKAIRDAKQRLAIDCDRVFIAGIGPGADAAYDISISHPDIFAGVCGISGKIDRYAEIYCENKHLGLPVYSVVGEKDISSRRSSAKTWNVWLQRDDMNNLILVEYRGRLPESFYEEFPAIFQWMKTQTRRLPNIADELQIECEVFRPWDNRYYFYEFLGLPAESTIWPEFWRSFGYEKTLKMEVTKKGNRFLNMRPSNKGSGAILSLSPEFVDFSQKIEITGRGKFNDFVQPTTKAILEDVRVRGDRQHPFWAVLIQDQNGWHPED